KSRRLLKGLEMNNKKTVPTNVDNTAAAGGDIAGGIFVYVSNAEDSNVSAFRLDRTAQKLLPLERVGAAPLVMPMAVGSSRFLYAAARAKPYAVFNYQIEPQSGELTWIGTSPLAESMVWTMTDKSGRWLLSASYG